MEDPSSIVWKKPANILSCETCKCKCKQPFMHNSNNFIANFHPFVRNKIKSCVFSKGRSFGVLETMFKPFPRSALDYPLLIWNSCTSHSSISLFANLAMIIAGGYNHIPRVIISGLFSRKVSFHSLCLSQEISIPK